MNLIRQIAKTVLTTCLSRDKLLIRGPSSIGRRSALALTFDDGPHPEYTPRLLDTLDELDLRVTFFVVGCNAAKYPHLIRRMAAAGHEIANHTYFHSDPRNTSTMAFLKEVRRTDELLSSLTGHFTKTVRPPKGELNWGKLQGLWQQHKTVALWNVDPKDFRMTSPDQMVEWCGTYQPHDGDVVLLHDNHQFAQHAVECMASRGVFQTFETTTINNWLRPTERRLLSVAT